MSRLEQQKKPLVILPTAPTSGFKKTKMTSHTDIFNAAADMAAPIKRGRRLNTVQPNITSELGGAPPKVRLSNGTVADAPYRSDRAGQGVRNFPHVGNGIMSVTTFKSTGRRRDDHTTCMDTDPTRTDRGDYQVVEWENKCKRHLEPQRHEPKPQGMHHTHRAVKEVPPFATNSEIQPIPFHRQRRFCPVPGADSAESNQDYIPKRSRTPPAGAKLHCENEGFTCVYSTNTADKAKLVAGGVRMIPFGKHGKSQTTTADKLAKARSEEEAKREAGLRLHRQKMLEVAQRIVDDRTEEVHGKKIGLFHPPERLGGPNATNLPVNPKHVVGMSAARGKTPTPGGASSTPRSAGGAFTPRPGWVR